MVVPDRQLSLAIGKDGQNARLAAKLTGWRIDIKSASAAEAEKMAKAEPLTEVEEEEIPAEIPSIIEPALVTAEVAADEAAEPLPTLDTAFTPLEIPLEPEVVDKPQIRFAEDVLAPKSAKPVAKSRKKKKSTRGKETDEDSPKARKWRLKQETIDDEEY